jgi:hypothetical protein
VCSMGSVRGGSARFAEERKPVLTRGNVLGRIQRT